MQYHWLLDAELVDLRLIDRSERVTTGFQIMNGELRAEVVDWDIPTFRADDSGSHSVAAQVHFCERHLKAGARAMGAFAGEVFVGIGLMTPEIRPGMAQLAYLHVSRPYRRQGVASRLTENLMRFASESGALQIYVSATPSESAVRFYQSLRFRLASPLPELYEVEPEDIHMIVDLPNKSLKRDEAKIHGAC